MPWEYHLHGLCIVDITLTGQNMMMIVIIIIIIIPVNHLASCFGDCSFLGNIEATSKKGGKQSQRSKKAHLARHSLPLSSCISSYVWPYRGQREV